MPTDTPNFTVLKLFSLVFLFCFVFFFSSSLTSLVQRKWENGVLFTIRQFHSTWTFPVYGSPSPRSLWYLQTSAVWLEDAFYQCEDRCPHATHCHSYHSYKQDHVTCDTSAMEDGQDSSGSVDEGAWETDTELYQFALEGADLEYIKLIGECLIWTSDLESLKKFVESCLQQQGK